MVVLNPPVQRRPHFLSPVPISSLRYNSTTRWRKKTPYKFNTPNYRILLYPPFSSNSPLSCTKKLRISAQFRRPTNRRNSLRKKLTEQQRIQPQQLNEVSSNPANDYDNSESYYSNLDQDYVDESNFNSNYGASEDSVSVDVLKSKPLGESVLWNKLESWVDQYKADSEFWGIGFNPIFTVFQDQEGKIESVVVNEEEVLKRNGIEPASLQQSKFDEDLTKVNSKISHAKFLAREMECGNYEIPKNCSVAKVVVSGRNEGFVDSIWGFTIPPGLPLKKLPKFGLMVLCGFLVVWVMRAVFIGGEDKAEYTRLEKEMLRRKMLARKEREKSVKDSVEVIHDPLQPHMGSIERPRLDKEELLSSITKKIWSGDALAGQLSSSNQATHSNDFDAKIMEIRAMARRAREVERGDPSLGDRDEGNELTVNVVSNKVEVVEKKGEKIVDLTNDLSDNNSGQNGDFNGIVIPFLSNDLKNKDAVRNEEALVDNCDTQTSHSSKTKAFNDSENVIQDVINQEKSDKREPDGYINMENTVNISDAIEINHTVDTSKGQSKKAKRTSGVISSVKEAKEFLSQKSEKQEPNEVHRGKIMPENVANLSNQGDKDISSNTRQSLEFDNEVFDTSILDGTNIGAETISSANNENWMENNFHTLEPVIKKIGGGFRKNYIEARQNIKQELDMTSRMSYPEFDGEDGEFDWMKDDMLREIVYQVRDNELAGRDPFYLMDEEDKLTFFEGLEKKVEKENEKLSNLHEWLHSSIENLDYGTDGISVYDTPEKIIPRWKGPPINKIPEFLDNFVEQRKTLVNENLSSSEKERKDGQTYLQKFRESPVSENILPKSAVNDQNTKNPKVVIEGSDGSLRAGKKSGKEYWEHTKKWSRGFLESYNAEMDPEIKAVMKDMGKDLDRWITDKEVQEAAALMNKIPEKGKKFIEKKLNKVKREMELFGPQAVVSKYREYGDQTEEDYLWWLDLPFILCIEVYTHENREQKIGLYSLEMAEDLELDPKQYHVIAFEDPGDCKNMSYIIQHHMEMLGNGSAFVVARPPKDAFREAKANGFSVTVIRKGELQLNVDQTLEEVEEQITEIGSKIYHDKIMREQSVDINALMKGVFGASKPSKRSRSRRRLRRPTK